MVDALDIIGKIQCRKCGVMKLLTKQRGHTLMLALQLTIDVVHKETRERQALEALPKTNFIENTGSNGTLGRVLAEAMAY